jgi:hypothetical protein
MAPVDGSIKSGEGRFHMSTSSTSFFHARSLLAVFLSATAIYFSQQTPARMDPISTTTESNSTAQLEEAISSLRGELITLQFRLDALELTSIEESAALGATEIEAEAKRVQLRALEAERITAAVEAVIDDRGVELAKEAQRRAKREQGRTGMSRWVDNSRNKLPNLYDRIAEKMDLDRQTEIAVEEILETGFETLTMITNELVEGDLDDGEVLALQIEAKDEFGNIIEQLDEVLDPQQMIHLGQIYSAEVDPKVGGAITNTGNQGDSANEG